MEYQQKKEQMLAGVEFTSLLSFNLVENKLERNFRAIVDALLLTQGRNEELASKTEQLDDRQALDRQKTSQEHESLKQALKLVSDRVAKLENAAVIPPMKALKGDSSKNIKQAERSESGQKGGQLEAPSEKNSFLEKKMNDVFQEISALKERMPTLKLMQSEFENMKRDLTSLRGELMTIGKSSKSIKRDSINPPTTTPIRPSFRRESASRASKTVGLGHSNSSVLLQQVDKENRTKHIDAKQGNRVQTNASNVISREDGEVDRQLEGLHIEVNTLNLCFEELKGLVQDLRKKDIRYHSTLAEVEDRQRKMQDQMRRDSESFEKALKGVQLDIIGLGNEGQSERARSSNSDHEDKLGKQAKEGGKKGDSGGSLAGRQQDSVNFKSQLNDKINKLQNSLNSFISQSEFNRFKSQMRGKMQQGERKHQKLVNEFQQQIRKIYDMFINKDLDLARLNELIAANAETVKENHSQAERKHNIAIARADQLKKNLQNLREDVQFYQAMNNDSKEVKAKAEEKKEGEMKSEGQGGSAVDPKALQDLKKYFNNKLHDQRAYLVGLIRDLQKKQNSASAVSQEIANLWDKANQLATFLSKKGDAEDIKKSLVYLQKKINKIGSQLMKAEDNTQDARIARTNWFCLSCDKNLMGYQGKLGKHIVWDSMPLKGTVKAADNTVKAVDKKGLPSLKK